MVKVYGHEKQFFNSLSQTLGELHDTHSLLAFLYDFSFGQTHESVVSLNIYPFKSSQQSKFLEISPSNKPLQFEP
jgi:hypothetical protein